MRLEPRARSGSVAGGARALAAVAGLLAAAPSLAEAPPAETPWRCERHSTGVRVALRGVWGARPDSVWAVGDQGVALRWNGTRWLQIPTGVEGDLLAVGGAGVEDVWAVGRGGISLRWRKRPTSREGAAESARWEEVPMGTRYTFTAVVPLAADDVWAVGQDPGTRRFADPGGEASAIEDGARPARGVLYHWDGRRWAEATPAATWPPLAAACALGGGSELLAAGARGRGPEGRPALARWSGGAWSLEPGPGKEDLIAVSSAGDAAWAASAGGRVFARRAGAWAAVGEPLGRVDGLWATGPGDLWAVGQGVRHFDGSAWTTLGAAAPSELRAVFGPAPGETWAVGDDGLALRCLGGTAPP